MVYMNVFYVLAAQVLALLIGGTLKNMSALQDSYKPVDSLQIVVIQRNKVVWKNSKTPLVCFVVVQL
jgi:hypothetical protein